MAFCVEGFGGARGHQKSTCSSGAAKKITSINEAIHRLRRLLRFTDLRNLRNLWIMSSFPEWLVPMAATLTQERFAGPEWLFERKFDGIRLLAFKRGREVRLYSRNRLLQDIPPVAAAIARLPGDDLVLDGEVDWNQAGYHLF